MGPIDDHYETPYPLQKATTTFVAKLRRDVEAHNAALATVEADVERMKASDETKWTPADDAAAIKLRQQQREVLVRELELRERAAIFFDMATADGTAAKEAAFIEWEKRSTDVKQQLVKMGFRESDEHGRDLLRDVVWRHPLVAEKFVEKEAIYDNFQLRQRNESATDQCRKALADYKQRATAALTA